ncbi:transmembrane protein 70, mitochondrial-like [Branchiostoma floridae]|uniref:Transmembrane protein 70, mitochondrial-like n=2 Tax=Branchiostoma floridae TaxID=7739 RepID=A0A9J7MV82_BRAFL|nr:transmembrane protein 70, mitochondrial-like [Branchiostoma floridae]
MAAFLQTLRSSFQASYPSRISLSRTVSKSLYRNQLVLNPCGAARCINTLSITANQKLTFGGLSLRPVFVKSTRAITTSKPTCFDLFDYDAPKPHEWQTPDGRLLYKGALANIVVKVKFFSYSTSLLGISLMTPIFWHGGISHYNVFAQVFIYLMSVGFILVSPAVLHFLSRGYVVRMYHDAAKDQYTVVTKNIILMEKKTRFTQEDVKVPELRRMFTTFMAGGKGYLVNEASFYHARDYDHLMGYDKPLDFDMEVPDEGITKDSGKEKDA